MESTVWTAWPGQNKLSPDGNHAYVTGINDHAPSWFDRNGATGILTYGNIKGRRQRRTARKSAELTLSPDGLFVYVTAENDDAVSWYDLTRARRLDYLGHLKDGVGGTDNLDIRGKSRFRRTVPLPTSIRSMTTPSLGLSATQAPVP